MKRMVLIATASLMLLSGCSSTMSDQEAALIREQLSKPTISMTCPDSGCNFSSFEYRDPNQTIDMPTNRNDVINNAISTSASVLLGVAPFYAITRAFDHMNDGVNINTSDSSDNRQIDNSTRDNSYRDNSQTDNSSRDMGLQKTLEE